MRRLHDLPKALGCVAACACLTASVALPGCASSATNEASSFADVAVQQGEDAANELIDVETWKAFAANSSAVVLGGSETSQADLENTCFSPASLYFALALAAEGADGEAQSQLLELLGADDANGLAAFCERWMSSLEDPFGAQAYDLDTEDPSDSTDLLVDDDLEAADGDEDKVAIANSIWANEDCTFKESYLATVQDKLDASAFNVAFGTQEADSQITDWISDETEGLLQPEFNTSSDDVAKLINTVYFKSSWADQFDSALTSDSTFHAVAGDEQVPFMHKSFDMGSYAEGGNFTACQLGFSNGYSMSFFLPNEGTTAADLFSDAATIQQMLDAEFDYRNIDLALPKFTIDSSFDDLIDALRALGVKDIFDPSNPGMFANMIESGAGENLYISDAIQETHLGLDEDGVEAAAYTALGVKAMGLMPEEEPIEFVVDRPFGYMLQSPDGVVLFTGIVNSIQAFGS